jgi:hypothetical protein
MLLLAKEDLLPRRYPRYRGERISVVLPCYNEDPELLRRSIRSVYEAEGRRDAYSASWPGVWIRPPLVRRRRSPRQ